MSEKSPERWHKARVANGEVVGGGYFVFRRGETTGRIKINPAKLPFEHGTLESAQREANRLSLLHPGVTFSIFQQSESVCFRADAKAEGRA